MMMNRRSLLFTLLLWTAVVFSHLVSRGRTNATAGRSSLLREESIEDKLLAESGNRFFKNATSRTKGMPDWAGKYPFMAASHQVDDENRICYVHVGKTAGSTMACSLGFVYDSCPVHKVQLPKGNLPFYTTNLIHKEFNDCVDKQISLYLFVVREPLARMKSWFTYERIKPGQKIYNKKNYARKELLFNECPFPTLNALGGPDGLGAQNTTECSRRAWHAVTGAMGFAAHNLYNYEYYYNQVLQQNQKPRIAVIRTEHLEVDWTTIETKLLQGPQPFGDKYNFSKKHTSKKKPDDYYLSPESQDNLCRALCQEIQVYKRILLDAKNLNESDYWESMKELEERCPTQALSDSC